MKAFNHPNKSNNWICPICNTNEDKEIVLIGIQGTREGNIAQAEQFHLDCIELYFVDMRKNKRPSYLAQEIEYKELGN